jgi:heptosyltransferase-1
MKILIVRVSSLGDVLHNMPMVSDIRRHLPQAQIDWVVEEAFCGLVALHRGVDNVIPFALRRWRHRLGDAETREEIKAFCRRLRRETYDVVIDSQGLLKTGVVMRLARLAPGGRRVGLGNGIEGAGYEGLSRIFHTESVISPSRIHAVARARRVGARTFGYKVETPADFMLEVPDVATPWRPERPYAVFFHGTSQASKLWPQQSWVIVGHALAQRGLPVLLAWGSAEEERAARQLEAAIPNAVVLPKLSMMEAVALAQGAALAVGLDTGLTHIAAAYYRPTVEIFCDSPRFKAEGNWSPGIVNLGDEGEPPVVAEVLAGIDRLLGPLPQDGPATMPMQTPAPTAQSSAQTLPQPQSHASTDPSTQASAQAQAPAASVSASSAGQTAKKVS